MNTTSMVRRLIGPALVLVLLSGLIVPHITAHAEGSDTDPSLTTETSSEETVVPAVSFLNAPTGLTTTAKNGNKIRLQWDPVEGAATYVIYEAEYDPDLGEPITEDDFYELDETKKTAYNSTDLTGGCFYTYRVAAVDATGTVMSEYTESQPSESYRFKLATPYATMHLGKSVTVSPIKEGSGSVTWSSAEPSIATVTKKGKITGKALGSTTVRATFRDVSIDINVTVTDLAIDVSHYQGKINWDGVRTSGVSVAMFKATEGTAIIDSTFNYNYSNARRVGIKVGCYSFSHATTVAQAKKEAKYVLKLLKGRPLDYPICMDFESLNVINKTTPAKRMKIILTYKKVIENAGYTFALYTGSAWINKYLIPAQLEGVNLWLARYNGGKTYCEYTGPGNIIMWQYGPEKITGISGNTDGNHLYNVPLIK